MTKTLTFNIKGFKTFAVDFVQQAIKNRKKLLLTVLFAFGIWCGTHIYIDNSSNVSNLLKELFKSMVSDGILKTFLLLLIVNASLIITAFFSGFFALGLPLTLISPCAAGLITGAINAWIFSAYRLNGVFFSLLAIIPFAVISAIMLFVSCNESVILSSRIVKAVFFGESGERVEVKGFLIRYLIIFVVLIASTFIQSLIIIKLIDKLLIV